MTDEKKTYSDDEYQFPHDEYVTPHGDEQQSAAETTGPVVDAPTPQPGVFAKLSALSSRIPAIKNKRVFIIVAVIIVAIMVLHLMRPSKPASLAPVAHKQTIQQQAPAIVQPQPQALVQAQPQMSLDTVNPQPSGSDSKIRDLEGQITDMQSNLSQAQETNQQLQKSVADLTAQVQNLSAQLGQILLSEKKGPKVKQIAYHLRAVVADRAWITSSAGETISVTVGDKIEQYGTVQSIDPLRGVVQTSSGRKIEYGSNDY